jgi:hypothetical protein
MKQSKKKTTSEEDVEVESSAKMVVVPDQQPIRRPRAAGDYLISTSESAALWNSKSDQQPMLKIMLSGNAITCLPRDPEKYPALIIDRISGSISTLACSELRNPICKVEISAHAIFGVITIQSERFLALASECTCVALVGKVRIFAITRADLVPISIQPSTLDKSQFSEVAQLAVGIERFLSSQGFFFAVDCDLSRPFTNLKLSTRLDPNVMDSAEDRYFWNREMCLELTQLGDQAHHWIVPMIHGAVHSDEFPLSSKTASNTKLTVALISRRSRLRAWPRDARGLDMDGSCGGLIETEQVLEHGGALSSYITARGSCPLLWVERSLGSGAAMVDEEGSLDALRLHIQTLFETLDGDNRRFNTIALINVFGGSKDEQNTTRFDQLFRKAGLSGTVTATALKLEAMTAGKVRALEDLLSILPWDQVLHGRGISGRVWSTKGSTVALGEGVADRQEVLFRIDGTDSVDRPAAVQCLVSYCALASFLDLLTGARTPPGQMLHGLSAEDLFRWKGLWLSTAENLARQVPQGRAYYFIDTAFSAVSILRKKGPGETI